MSLIIFFGMAFFIFVMGLVVIGVTLNHWRKESKIKKQASKMESKA